MPEFFPFEARDKHDLDALAKRLLGQRLIPQDIVAALRREFEQKDRFWRALFPNFDRFPCMLRRSSAWATDGRWHFSKSTDTRNATKRLRSPNQTRR
jgi:hypothetical protein